MYYDYLYFVLLIAMAVSMIISRRVQSIYNRYSSSRNRRGITGAQAAQTMLRNNGIYDVTVAEISGSLSDHYDPRTNVISLSTDVYHGTSPVAVGVACHEAGHAVQHAAGYFPVRIRQAIIPVTNIGSRLAMPLIIGGLILAGVGSVFYQLVYLGILLFSFSTLFQLVTLPVEFDASHRALNSISNLGILASDELPQAKKVLWAAAMTYVAALAVSLIQLLRFISIYGRRSRR